MSLRSGEIADAARELIIESNGALPTVRQIAARSFLSPAAIYVHFPNFDAIVEHVRIFTIRDLIAVIQASGASTLGEAVDPAATWMFENQALLVAYTCGSSKGVSAENVALILDCLAKSGEFNVDPRVVLLAVQLVGTVPSLVTEFGYGPHEIATHLRSLASPLEVASAHRSIEAIRA